MRTIEDYQEAGQEIYHKLHLSTYPVGIKYFKEMNEIPAGVMRPSDTGGKLSLCQAFTQTRCWGASIAMTEEDNFCTPSTVKHYWVDVSLEEEFVESQVRQGWHKDAESERRNLAAEAAKLEGADLDELREYNGLISTPLTEPVAIPDSVLVYGDGVQITNIIHALCYEFLHVPTSSFVGFGESCVKGGFLPFATQKPQVVLPGAGDRFFGGCSEHEIAVGMPAHLIFYVLQYLFKTGNEVNMGYPAKKMLATNLTEDLTPGFKYMREKIDEKKNQK